jgi:hypothetical protein
MSGRAWDDATEYASPHTEGRSAARAKISDLGLRLKQRFLYLFDYGDEHRFEVQLLAVNPDAPKGDYLRVVGDVTPEKGVARQNDVPPGHALLVIEQRPGYVRPVMKSSMGMAVKV